MVKGVLIVFLIIILFASYYFSDLIFLQKGESLEIDYLGQHLNDLNQKYERLKKDIDYVKNDLRRVVKSNQDLKDSLAQTNPDNINFKNSIIHSLNEVLFLKRLSCLSNPYYLEKIRLKLLYKATDQGDELVDVYNIVKGQTPIIILIHTDKNKRFGAYTQVKLEEKPNSYNKHQDNKTFFFDLNERIKYKTNPSKTDVFYDQNYIDFDKIDSYDFDLRIMNNFFKEGAFEKNDKEAYKPTKFKLSGQEHFNIFEIEIYQVNIIK